MPKLMTRPCAAALLCALIAGCSTEQAYYSGQAWQRNECNRIPDQSERERCLSRLGTSYDEYKRQSEPARKP